MLANALDDFFQADPALNGHQILQPDPLHRKAKRLKKFNQGVGFARDLPLLQDFTLGIHNAHARLFQ